ncbi:Phophatidylinositol-4-phosphate 5-kinase [Vibrio maritimus]|uniref:Phophatidylinositol-4-phosphate 5-kinase n=1 Tax=Vibrio maritimus TaxID=990268 RepID=A0A090TBQ1_9VIBR|nr:Phophatidylinositol-4-phosphate 5-kinase [Vibrio maritimus]
MKSSIAIIAGVLTCASIGAYATETTVEDSGNTVDYVQVRNGVAYQVNETTPFTGRLTRKYDTGQNALQVKFANGKAVGSETTWYPNGQVASSINYKEGVATGEWKQWYDNGQLKTDTHYQNGKLSGTTLNGPTMVRRLSMPITIKVNCKVRCRLGMKMVNRERKPLMMVGKRMDLRFNITPMVTRPTKPIMTMARSTTAPSHSTQWTVKKLMRLR